MEQIHVVASPVSAFRITSSSTSYICSLADWSARPSMDKMRSSFIWIQGACEHADTGDDRRRGSM